MSFSYNYTLSDRAIPLTPPPGSLACPPVVPTHLPFYSKSLTTPRTSYYDSRIEQAEMRCPADLVGSWTPHFGACSKSLVVFVLFFIIYLASKVLNEQMTTPISFLGGVYCA